MHIAARVGIAAGTAGAVGFGMHQAVQHVSQRTVRDHAELDREVAKQSQAWDSWSTKFDREFPGRRLDTPADHRRLDAFLRDHPAPSWVGVEHQDYTKARLSFDGPIVDDKHFPVEREKSLGYGGVGAIGMGVIGGGLLVGGLRSSGSALATAGMIGGGAALAALGVGMIGMIANDIRLGTNLEGYNALVRRVHSEMQ